MDGWTKPLFNKHIKVLLVCNRFASSAFSCLWYLANVVLCSRFLPEAGCFVLAPGVEKAREVTLYDTFPRSLGSSLTEIMNMSVRPYQKTRFLKKKAGSSITVTYNATRSIKRKSRLQAVSIARCLSTTDIKKKASMGALLLSQTPSFLAPSEQYPHFEDNY